MIEIEVRNKSIKR